MRSAGTLTAASANPTRPAQPGRKARPCLTRLTAPFSTASVATQRRRSTCTWQTACGCVTAAPPLNAAAFGSLPPRPSAIAAETNAVCTGLAPSAPSVGYGPAPLPDWLWGCSNPVANRTSWTSSFSPFSLTIARSMTPACLARSVPTSGCHTVGDRARRCKNRRPVREPDRRPGPAPAVPVRR